MKMQETLYSIFNASAEDHWWFVARRVIVRRLVGKIIGNKPCLRILDIGSGVGATLKQLEEMGVAFGVDISPEAIGYCRDRGCRRLCLVEEERLPFGDNSFDLVISMDILEHIDQEYRHLREYRRVLKKGGFLLITVPALSWLWSNHDRANRHRRRYSRSGLRNLLVKEGWKIERLSYFCTLLFPLVMAIRLISKMVTRITGDYDPAWNFKIPGFGLNHLLCRIFSWESAWLTRRNFPIGSSLLGICRK
jgi:SAM-dependent methyltransferase